jgi:PAS domain S-box-containing protein
MLYTTRPDGQCDFVNQLFYDFTGLPPGSALGDGWTAALHPDDLTRTRTRWQSCVSTGVPFEIEFRMREFDGTYRWFTSRSLPVRDGHDRILMWVGACIDIDSQKQAEQRLREDERRKDQFLAGLGDELRDPLAPIRFAVQALDARLPVEPETRRMTGVIEREVGQMASLIDDLLEVSRIAQGRTRLNMEPCDLSAIAFAAVERCRGELARQDILLSVSVPDQPLTMLGDPRRLAQVVDHILRSAASFTDPGGTVALKLSADADGAGARLVVRHPGSGLEPQALARLFEPSGQADIAPGAPRGSLGLGLVLVRSLVAMHGGRVLRIADEPGRGSAFCLWLPLRRAGVPAFRP